MENNNEKLRENISRYKKQSLDAPYTSPFGLSTALSQHQTRKSRSKFASINSQATKKVQR